MSLRMKFICTHTHTHVQVRVVQGRQGLPDTLTMSDV